MRWKIFYGDGSTYTGDPYTAPARNVQAIIADDEHHGWHCVRTCDYYWYLPDLDLWQGGDMFGLFDHLIEPGQKRVLFGRTLGNQEFADVMAMAYDDPDLPPKTGWRPNERR